MPLIVHISDDKLIGGILEAIQFRDSPIAANISSREIDGFLNMPVCILIRLAEIQQQEGGISRDPQHISSVCHRCGLCNPSSYRVY